MHTHTHGIPFVLANCSCARGLPWSVGWYTWCHLIEETDFLSTGSYQLQIASQPGVGICAQHTGRGSLLSGVWGQAPVCSSACRGRTRVWPFPSVCVCREGGASTCGLVLITVGILSSESGCLVGGSLGPHSGVFSIVLCAQNIPVLATA